MNILIGIAIFVFGGIVGFSISALFRSNSDAEALEQAYEAGKTSERARIIRDVNEKFGVGNMTAEEDFA